jgi:hypothetical protein
MEQCGAYKHDEWRGYMTVLAVRHTIRQSISIHTAVIRPMIKYEVDQPPVCFRQEVKWMLAIRPDGTMHYKAHLVIQGYIQPDFGETYAPVGKVTTLQYLIFHVAKHVCHIDNLDVVTGFLNPEVVDNVINVTLPDEWPDAVNTPAIIN